MGKLPYTIVKNGIYYLHVRVPKALIEVYGRKRFITESLGRGKKLKACHAFRFISGESIGR